MREMYLRANLIVLQKGVKRGQHIKGETQFVKASFNRKRFLFALVLVGFF